MMFKLNCALIHSIKQFLTRVKTVYWKLILLLVSSIIYALIFNWKFSLLIMISIAWHEQSHIWMMNKLGIRNRGWFAVPMLGAIALPKEHYLSYFEQAQVALAGPFGGMLLAIVSALLYPITNQPIFAASATFMCVLNLFNLIPVSSLDGGQIAKCFSCSWHRNLGLVFSVLSLLLMSILWFKYQTLIWLVLCLFSILDVNIELAKRSKYRYYVEPEYKRIMNKCEMRDMALLYCLTASGLMAILSRTAFIPQAGVAKVFLGK